MEINQLTAEAFVKFLNKELLSEEELQALKDYLTGYGTLADMDDFAKERIQSATLDNVFEEIKQAFVDTAYRSFWIRCRMPIPPQE